MSIFSWSCLLPLPLALCAAYSTIAADHAPSKAPAVVPFEDATFVTVAPGRLDNLEIVALSSDPRSVSLDFTASSTCPGAPLRDPLAHELLQRCHSK